MSRYKNVLNILAGTFVLVFIAWMFSYATPDYTKNWKPKTAMKYESVDVIEVPMSVKLFGPKQYSE